MAAPGLDALARGPQYLDDAGFVMPALAAGASEADGLARQCAVDEHRLAAGTGDTAPFDRGLGLHALAQAASYWRQWGSALSASQARTRSTSAA
jgi:hypothetical protein